MKQTDEPKDILHKWQNEGDNLLFGGMTGGIVENKYYLPIISSNNHSIKKSTLNNVIVGT